VFVRVRVRVCVVCVCVHVRVFKCACARVYSLHKPEPGGKQGQQVDERLYSCLFSSDFAQLNLNDVCLVLWWRSFTAPDTRVAPFP